MGLVHPVAPIHRRVQVPPGTFSAGSKSLLSALGLTNGTDVFYISCTILHIEMVHPAARSCASSAHTGPTDWSPHETHTDRK